MSRSKAVTLLAMLACGLALSACDTTKVEVQKSPCVGLENSPCGPKRHLSGNPEQA